MQLDILNILAELERRDVRFVVAGGVAAVLHGRLRMTNDLDLVLDMGDANLVRAGLAIAALEYRPRPPVSWQQFCDPTQRMAWQTERNMVVLSLWSERFRATELDLFLEPPLPTERLFGNAEVLRLQGVAVPVICIEDLIACKRIAGRPIDLDDIAALEAIARSRRPQ